MVYETDSHHDTRSRILRGMYATRSAAINAVVRNAWEEYVSDSEAYSRKVTADAKRKIREELEREEQTQCNPVCHEIVETALNEWYEL